MGGALGDQLPADRTAAAAAGLPLAAIDPALAEKVAFAPVGMHEVIHRGPAGGDRPPQQAAQGQKKPVAVVAAEAAGSARGAQRGSKQSLVGVDVADPSDQLLIEQHALDRGATSTHAGGKLGFADAERVRTEALEARTRLAPPKPEDPAELTRIPQKQHGAAAGKAEREVNVAISGGAGTAERLRGNQLTRHAKMHTEGAAVV